LPLSGIQGHNIDYCAGQGEIVIMSTDLLQRLEGLLWSEVETAEPECYAYFISQDVSE